MRFKIFVVAFLCITFLSVNVFGKNQNSSNQNKLKYIPGKILVKFKPQNQNGLNKISSIQSKFAIKKVEQTISTKNLKKKVGVEELERLFTFDVETSTDVETLAKQIAKEEGVQYAQPDYLHPFDKIPNDSLYSKLYPLPQVKADTAWGISLGDSTVSVAIIDSGVDWDHPDLIDVIWTNKNEVAGNNIDDDNNGYVDDIRGWDFVTGITNAYSGEDGNTEDNNPMDFDGHGTHVSGIAGGSTNNKIGIASLGWGIRIMALRSGYHSSDGNGYIPSSFAAKAYVYAANNGASVANQSSGTSEVVLEGAYYAFKNGVVICNSAGNGNSDGVGLLGKQPWALSVGALASNDKKASYSSYGKDVDISAPGGDFSGGNFQGYLSSVVNPSTFYGGKLYENFQGTSMSSPLVASLAGLIKSKFKNMTAGQIMFQIVGTADNIDGVNPTFVGKLGAGRINALRALTETAPMPKPIIAIKGIKIDDSTGGNGNNQLDPGESIKMIITLENSWGTATNVNATLNSNHWTTKITKATSNFGTIFGLTKLDSSTKSNVSDPITISISSEAIPSVIPMSVTITADGGYSVSLNFNLAINSLVLLVDDDDGFDSEKYYFNAFNKLNVVYDYWDHSKMGTPSASLLKNYPIVVWACEWGFPALDSVDRASLEGYFATKGKLFISGQDIGWDMADVAGATVPNEYGRTAGASKIWYEKYLKANYINDDAAFSALDGIIGDPISSGISLSRYQPGRATAEQYPEVVDTINGSTPIFKYTGGAFVNKFGGVKYDGADYKLVHMGFGGFESIVDSLTRVKVMGNIMNWFLGTSIVVDKIGDTENTSTPIAVKAQINANVNLEKVELYWDTDGAMPFKKVAMTTSGSGAYTGNIPTQTTGGEVQYFVLVKTVSSYLPFSINKFKVGPDQIPPVIIVADTLKNSIRLKGPYTIFATATDNLTSGIDTTTFFVNYNINGGTEFKVAFTSTSTKDLYKASIVPSTTLVGGDIINYYLTVKDNSTQKNSARYPAIGTKSFKISTEIVDNFESKKDLLWSYGSWDFATTYKQSGLQSIADSKSGNYLPNTENILLMKEGFDLTAHSVFSISFYRRANIHTTDTLFVDATKDGTSWETILRITGFNVGMKQEVMLLNRFTGAGANNFKIRFRLVADAANQNDGIYIDDLTFNAQVGGSVSSENSSIPTDYKLEQNYPNPFNPSTTIKFSLPKTSDVKLQVIDVLGKVVETLVDEEVKAGNYKINFDASRLSSGVYYYTIKTNSFKESKRMILLK